MNCLRCGGAIYRQFTAQSDVCECDSPLRPGTQSVTPHCHISSAFGTLKLDDEDHAAYRAAEKELFKEFWLRTYSKYGIWANNQGRFVQGVGELNEWDSHFEIQEYLGVPPESCPYG